MLTVALMISDDHNSFQNRLRALALCTNLRAFSWTDSGYYMQHDHIFVAYLEILQRLRLDDLHIAISSGVSVRVWDALSRMKGLRSLGLWTSHSALKDLSPVSSCIGGSIEHLELGSPSRALQMRQSTLRITIQRLI